MKINNSEMIDIVDVINDYKKKYHFEEAIKKNTLFNFWKQIAGKQFAPMSKCHSINDKGVLTVACLNSYVSNELFMFKEELLKKIKIYSAPLNINITDINFSHKIWQTQKQDKDLEPPQEIKRKKFTDEEIEEADFDYSETEAIKNSLDDLPFVGEEQKYKMFQAIVKNLKEQKLKREEKV